MHQVGSESILTQNLLLASSMLMSIIAFIYTYSTNTKKYELASSYRTEVIKWYSDTILILKRSLHAVHEKDTAAIQRLNADLSAQIEIGRMYFPNIKDDNGKKKPLAYKGSRHVILDCLVFCHTIMNSNDSFSNKSHLIHLHRIFTSKVFEQLDPHNFIKLTKRFTGTQIGQQIGFENYDNDETLIEIIAFIQNQKD